MAILFLLLPVVWSTYLNANYLSTKTFLLYLASALALLALPDVIKIKAFPKALVLLLLTVFVYYVGYHFIDVSYYNVLLLFKMLSFVFITFYIYSLNMRLGDFLKSISWPYLAMWLFILAVTGYEVFNLRVLDGNIKTDIILSTFGNINMFSEFAIISLPFFFAWVRFENRIPQWLKLLMFGFLTFLILYGRSRSATMGLGAWLVFKGLQGIRRQEWAAMLAALVLFAVSHFASDETAKISKFVPSAFSERASLYRGTIEAIADHPFGIPPGQFMNVIVPYLIGKKAPPNEFAYFDQPHSEFLKWGIQYGWGMLLLALCCFAFLAKELWSRYRSEKAGDLKSHNSLYLESFIMLVPQALFQFPFENPATILLLACLFGLYLSSYAEKRELNLKYVKPLFGALALAGIVNSFLFLESIAAESIYPRSADLMDVSCNLYPVNFRSCYWKNKDLLVLKNVEAFRANFKTDYRKNMFFCDNLRLLPEYFNYSRSAQKTCEALQLYKLIYPNQTHFTQATMDNCASYPPPFTFESPQQFTQKFRDWFDR